MYHGVTSSFFGKYRYFAGIRFTWRSVFPVGITNLAGTPFSAKGGLAVSKRGPEPPIFLKKGARAPFLREKGVPAKKMIPKCTDRDFPRYRYGKYREIPTDTDRKIPMRYNSSNTPIENRGLSVDLRPFSTVLTMKTSKKTGKCVTDCHYRPQYSPDGGV